MDYSPLNQMNKVVGRVCESVYVPASENLETTIKTSSVGWQETKMDQSYAKF